jgi:hypothetical protein
MDYKVWAMKLDMKTANHGMRVMDHEMRVIKEAVGQGVKQGRGNGWTGCFKESGSARADCGVRLRCQHQLRPPRGARTYWCTRSLRSQPRRGQCRPQPKHNSPAPSAAIWPPDPPPPQVQPAGGAADSKHPPSDRPTRGCQSIPLTGRRTHICSQIAVHLYQNLFCSCIAAHQEAVAVQRADEVPQLDLVHLCHLQDLISGQDQHQRVGLGEDIK